MASGTKSKSGPRGKGTPKGRGGRAARGVAASRPKPWGTILAVVFIVLLAGGVFTYAFMQINEKNKWVVSDDNQDPSENIPGVERNKYDQGLHVTAEQRVAYDQSPPFGGPHDQVWADCQGTVYPTAVRTENMIHSLEHGAVWIAYNPDQIKDDALNKLRLKVEGQPYMMMSPYPGLDRPISLQSWGHRLKLDSADDTRIDDFIKSLRQNRYQNPEPRGRCDAPDPSAFDVTNPPPFVAEPPGPDAVKMDGTGAKNEAQAEQNGEVPTPTAPPTAPTGEAPPSGAATGQQPPPSQ